MCTQKNRLNEAVLFSTQNIYQKLWAKKYLQFYTEKFCLSKPVKKPKQFFINSLNTHDAEQSGSVGRVLGLLVRSSSPAESLCSCVLEQDTLAPAWYCCLVLVQPRKTGNHLDKVSKQTNTHEFFRDIMMTSVCRLLFLRLGFFSSPHFLKHWGYCDRLCESVYYGIFFIPTLFKAPGLL